MKTQIIYRVGNWIQKWCYMYSANNIGRRIQSRVLNLALSKSHTHYHKVKEELDSYPSALQQNFIIFFKEKTLVLIIRTTNVFSCVYFSLWCFPFSPDACFHKFLFQKTHLTRGLLLTNKKQTLTYRETCIFTQKKS